MQFVAIFNWRYGLNVNTMAAADHGAWRAKIYWQSILASWSVGSNHRYIDCIMQYCSISSVSAMEILQYYTKPSTCILHNLEILTICIIEFCCGNAYVFFFLAIIYLNFNKLHHWCNICQWLCFMAGYSSWARISAIYAISVRRYDRKSKYNVPRLQSPSNLHNH